MSAIITAAITTPLAAADVVIDTAAPDYARRFGGRGPGAQRGHQFAGALQRLGVGNAGEAARGARLRGVHQAATFALTTFFFATFRAAARGIFE